MLEGHTELVSGEQAEIGKPEHRAPHPVCTGLRDQTERDRDGSAPSLKNDAASATKTGCPQQISKDGCDGDEFLAGELSRTNSFDEARELLEGFLRASPRVTQSVLGKDGIPCGRHSPTVSNVCSIL